MLDNDAAKALLVEFAKIICIPIAPLFLNYDPVICPGVIDQQFRDAILPILLEDILSEKNLCDFELEVCDKDKWEPINLQEFVKQKVSEKPKHLQSNDYLNQLYSNYHSKPQVGDDNLIHIAMISDIHIDYDYTEGASNDCGRPLCCRSDSGKAKEAIKRAGKWGDYQCDIPSWTLDSMLGYIKEEI